MGRATGRGEGEAGWGRSAAGEGDWVAERGARLCVSRGGSTWGLGGIKPPYLLNTHRYPLYYLDETMKRKRRGRRREEEKEEESGHDPPLYF